MPAVRWTLVGKVPAVLSYEMRDGSPISAEMIANIRNFGAGLFTKTVRAVSFASKRDALFALAQHLEAHAPAPTATLETSAGGR